MTTRRKPSKQKGGEKQFNFDLVFDIDYKAREEAMKEMRTTLASMKVSIKNDEDQVALKRSIFSVLPDIKGIFASGMQQMRTKYSDKTHCTSVENALLDFAMKNAEFSIGVTQFEALAEVTHHQAGKDYVRSISPIVEQSDMLVEKIVPLTIILNNIYIMIAKFEDASTIVGLGAGCRKGIMTSLEKQLLIFMNSVAALRTTLSAIDTTIKNQFPSAESYNIAERLRTQRGTTRKGGVQKK